MTTSRFDKFPLRVAALCVCCVAAGLATPSAQAADGKKSPAAPFITLLKSGKLPAERVGMVVEMACAKGEPDDLAFIFSQAADPKAWPIAARLKAFDLLADAAQIRKTIPSGDLSPLKQTLL